MTQIVSEKGQLITVITVFRERVTCEEWLIRELGAYLPGVYEEVSNEATVFYKFSVSTVMN